MRVRHPLRKFVDTTGGSVPQEEIDAALVESGGKPEDVVEAFQELPLIKDVSMSGWSASLAVVGIAALTGAWFSRRY